MQTETSSLIGKLITAKFTDRKEKVTGYLIDYTDDWTLIKYNPVDYIIDGYLIFNNKNVKSVFMKEHEEWTEKVLNLKGLKPKRKNIIPLNNLKTILEFLTKKFGIFQLSTQEERCTYLGRFKSLSMKKLIIESLNPKAEWSGEMEFKLKDIQLIQFDNDYINSLKLILEKNRSKI